jgi:hypothetical protein
VSWETCTSECYLESKLTGAEDSRRLFAHKKKPERSNEPSSVQTTRRPDISRTVKKPSLNFKSVQGRKGITKQHLRGTNLLPNSIHVSTGFTRLDKTSRRSAPSNACSTAPELIGEIVFCKEDLSQPRLIEVAPACGPSTGGTIVLLGVTGTSSLIEDVCVQLDGENSDALVGIVPVAECANVKN